MAEERKESVILSFEVDEGASIESIASLTKANKALREERSKLNIASLEGKKRAQEINATLDQNTNKIKNNVSALEKQKINIGNYKSALDGVHPALGKVGAGLEAGTKGIMGMVRASLAFIATPLGAALAAIVAVFTLLKAALSQNDALMDKFENVTNAVGVVLEIVVARVGKLGEALIALASGNFSEAFDKVGQAVGGLGDELENAVKQQRLLLEESRNIEDAERNLRIEIAKQQTAITALIKESKNRNLTLDQSSALLQEASKRESELQRMREDIAVRNLRVVAKQLRSDKEFQQQSNENFDQYVARLLASSKLGEGEKNKLVDEIVKVEEARNSGLVLQQKIENDLAAIQDKRAEAIKKQTEALKEQAAEEAANRRIATGSPELSNDDPLIGAFETRAKVLTNLEDRLQDDLKKRKDKAATEDIERANKGAEIEKQIQLSKLQIVSDVLGATTNLLNQESQEFKAIASAQALINTYAAANAAYKSGAQINVFFGVLAAAAAIAAGLANVAKINGVEFAEGGWTGPGNKWDPVGVVHADEYVTPKRVKNLPQAQPHIAALEQMRIRGFADGGLVTNMNSFPIDQTFQLANIVKNLPPAVLDVREVTKKQRTIKVKEAISKR